MMKETWDFLDSYRGTIIKGEWPTIPEMLTVTLDRFPNSPCFTVFNPDRQTMTYSEVFEQIQRIAGYLCQKGLKKGDYVGLSGKNSPEWGLVYLAVFFAGGILVPLDYQLSSEKIEQLLSLVEPSFVFCGIEKFESIDNARAKIAIQKISLETLDKKEKGISLKDLTSDPSLDKKTTNPLPKEDDLAAILFTSGTTGNEKGVMLTHKNFMTDILQAGTYDFMPVSHDDVFYALLPLHHSYSMTAVFIGSFTYGGEVVFQKNLAVGQIMKDLKKGKITMFMGIPLLFNKILKGMMKEVRAKGFFVNTLIGFLMRLSGLIKLIFHVNPGKKMFNFLLKKASLDSIRICICGGGPLAPETFRRYNELGLNFVQGYGLTETSPIITLNPVHHFKVHSVGKPFALLDVKIDEPNELGIGEILVKGPTVCKGYFNNQEETKALFNAEGYLKTGDVGYLDKENYLYLTGRQKSLIVTEGGKNVFPEEIEDLFQLFLELEQVLIKGYIVNEETKSEGIEAVIFPSTEFTKRHSSEEVRKRIDSSVRHVNSRLLSYKRITKITVVDEPLEMTTTRKIKRNAVLKMLEEREMKEKKNEKDPLGFLKRK